MVSRGTAGRMVKAMSKVPQPDEKGGQEDTPRCDSENPARKPWAGEREQRGGGWPDFHAHLHTLSSLPRF